MLKKENFIWCEKTKRACEDLKKMMSSTPVLGLSNFPKVFVVEVDTSWKGV